MSSAEILHRRLNETGFYYFAEKKNIIVQLASKVLPKNEVLSEINNALNLFYSVVLIQMKGHFIC